MRLGIPIYQNCNLSYGLGYISSKSMVDSLFLSVCMIELPTGSACVSAFEISGP